MHTDAHRGQITPADSLTTNPLPLKSRSRLGLAPWEWPGIRLSLDQSHVRRTLNRPQLRHPGYPREDWKAVEGRWQLINGAAYDMAPAPSTEHQRITAELPVAIVKAREEAKRKSGGGTWEAFFVPTDAYH